MSYAYVLRRASLLGGVLLSFTLSAAPAIDTVSPKRVDYIKGGEVTVTLHDAAPDSRLLITPGGPVLQGQLTLPAAADDIAANGTLTAVAAGRAGILFIDPATLQVSGSYHDGGVYIRLALHGDQLLAADRAGDLLCLDIHDPRRPRLLSRVALGSAPTALSWHGGHAYALLDKHSLQVIDTRDPAKLHIFATVRLEQPAQSLTDDGRHALVAAGDDGLLILDGDSGRILGRYRTTGAALDVTEQRGLAFVALGTHGLLVLDVRKADAPQWIGSEGKLGDVRRVAVQDQRVLLFDAAGQVSLVDIRHPDQPTAWATYQVRAAVQAAALDKHMAWAVSGSRLVKIDFSPEPPQLGNQGMDVGRGVNFGGERRAAIDGKVIYVADWFSGLHLYDISRPAHPRLLSSFHTAGSSKGVTVRDGIAYVADDDHGLEVVDVHDPLNPKLIANLPTPGLAYIPKLVGDILYLAGHRGGFQIIDVKDPAKPRLISSVATPGMAWGIAVVNGIAFVADDQAGLLTLDVNDPAHVHALGQFNPNGRAEDVVVQDGIAYVSFFDQGLYVLDVHDPAAPKPLAQLQAPGNARGIALQNDRLYLADWLAGVEVIDVHDPARPQLLGSYDTPGAAWGVNAEGDYVFVADWWGGFLTLDVKDPRRPVLAGRYHEQGEVRQIAAKGNYLFAANGEGGLQIFDDKNPLNPTWITGVDTAHPAVHVFIHDTTAYVGEDNGAVLTVDISNPFQAFEIGELDLPAPAEIMQVKGDTAYFALPGRGIIIADISTPRWPKEVARFITPVADMVLEGDTLYVLTHNALLQQLDVSTPRRPVLRTQDAVSGDSTLLRRLGDTWVVYQPRRGLIALRTQDKGFKPVASYPFRGAVSDLAAADGHLYATVENDGVYDFTLDDGGDDGAFHVAGHYPLTVPATAVTVHDGTLYLAGDRAITALAPLPSLAMTRAGETVRFTLPPDTPQGSYNLVLRGADGIEAVATNALQVGMSFSRPKITQEEFERLLKAYRAKNPGRLRSQP
jgi:hypothetical protein